MDEVEKVDTYTKEIKTSVSKLMKYSDKILNSLETIKDELYTKKEIDENKYVFIVKAESELFLFKTRKAAEECKDELIHQHKKNISWRCHQILDA